VSKPEPDEFQWDYSYFKWQDIPREVRRQMVLDASQFGRTWMHGRTWVVADVSKTGSQGNVQQELGRLPGYVDGNDDLIEATIRQTKHDIRILCPAGVPTPKRQAHRSVLVLTLASRPVNLVNHLAWVVSPGVEWLEIEPFCQSSRFRLESKQTLPLSLLFHLARTKWQST
jgi:hypothetical protein